MVLIRCKNWDSGSTGEHHSPEFLLPLIFSSLLGHVCFFSPNWIPQNHARSRAQGEQLTLYRGRVKSAAMDIKTSCSAGCSFVAEAAVHLWIYPPTSSHCCCTVLGRRTQPDAVLMPHTLDAASVSCSGRKHKIGNLRSGRL